MERTTPTCPWGEFAKFEEQSERVQRSPAGVAILERLFDESFAVMKSLGRISLSVPFHEILSNRHRAHSFFRMVVVIAAGLAVVTLLSFAMMPVLFTLFFRVPIPSR